MAHTIGSGKLVGCVPIGRTANVIRIPRIHLTNPNCREVAERLWIVVYKSKFASLPGIVTPAKYDGVFKAVSSGMVNKSSIKPHESFGCPLHMLLNIDPKQEDLALFYIEIFWVTDGKLPLIGFQLEETWQQTAPTKIYYSESQSQLVYCKQ